MKRRTAFLLAALLACALPLGACSAVNGALEGLGLGELGQKMEQAWDEFGRDAWNDLTDDAWREFGFGQSLAWPSEGPGAKLPPLPKGAPETESGEPAKPVEEAPPAPALPVLDISQDPGGLTDDQIAVLSVLHTDISTLTDDAAILADLPVRRVLSALTVLEIDGYVCRQGARSFLRTVELKKE